MGGHWQRKEEEQSHCLVEWGDWEKEVGLLSEVTDQQEHCPPMEQPEEASQMPDHCCCYRERILGADYRAVQ